MTFRTKVLLALTLVGLLPCALAAVFSYRASRRELLQTVGGAQLRAAQDAARADEQFVLHAVESLRLTQSYIPFATLAPDHLAEILKIPYRQMPYVSILTVLDEEGRALAPPLYDTESGAHHEVRTAEDVSQFATEIPLAAARDTDVTLGPVYIDGGNQAHLAVVVRIPGPPRRYLVAELSLADRGPQTSDIAAASLAYVVDNRRTVFASNDSSPLSTEEVSLLTDAATQKVPLSKSVTRQDGSTWLLATVPMKQLGWQRVLGQPAQVAFRPAERVRTYSLYWLGVGLVLTLGLGLFLARGVTGPLAELSRVAKAVAGGAPAERVAVENQDEVGDFARAFNVMTDELQRRATEIQSWNQELQKRVDRKTEELKVALDQVARTRRLAALASMGAGVAHELNNPLTGVMGLVALVQKELGPASAQGELLGMVLDESRRMARIIQEMKTLAESQRELPGTTFVLTLPVRAVLQENAERFGHQRIRVQADLAEKLPLAQGDPEQIQQVVAHLVANAVQAMAGGGELRVSVQDVNGEALRMDISDTGPGIPANIRERVFDPFFTTRSESGRPGLGLTVSHRIVEAHHGKITLESVEGKGTTFTVMLPTAGQSAHLV